MSRPEDFSKRLTQSVNESKEAKLQRRQKEKQQKKEAQEARRLAGIAGRQYQKERKEELKQKNEKVLGLNEQLGLQQYMKALETNLGLKRKLRTWGPENGIIGHSLVYRKALRFLEVGTQTITIPSRRIGPRDFSSAHKVEWPVNWLRRTKDVLGVVLDHEGWGRIYNQTCAKGSNYHPNSTNPLTWLIQKGHQVGPLKPLNPVSSWNLYHDSMDPGTTEANSFNLNNQEGLDQFTQHLTDFFLGVKE